MSSKCLAALLCAASAALLLKAADQPRIDSRKVAASGTPTVVIVNMDKPVILTEFIDDVAAVFAAFGAGDAATLDLVFGKSAPSGKLPFDLPSDMPSVMAQAADIPFDMDDPLFKFGFGLSYGKVGSPARK